MSVSCGHGSFSSSIGCPDCRMDRIEALLERIADAVAPTPEQQQARSEAEDFERSVSLAQALERIGNLPPRYSVVNHVNAIGGPQTGRGVK